VIAIDIGSSSVRAIGYDARARVVPGLEIHRPYALRTDAMGAMEVDADALVDLVALCLDDVSARLDRAGVTPLAVACCTFWHSLIGVDPSGRACTPVYTWADTRSASVVPHLRRLFDEEAVHQRTGARFHSSYLPAKLLWLREACPDLFVRSLYWMSLGEYLYLRLFEERRVSISMASGTGLFDQHTCEWDVPLLRTLQISPDTLSPVAEFTRTMTGLRGQFAGRWQRLSTVPWFLALGDGACNNIGSGAYDESSMALMIGTSGAIRVVREAADFTVPRGLWTYHVDQRRIVQGGALSEGGNVFAWLVHTMRTTPPADFEARLAAVPPDSHGLTLLPFFAGERSPGWRPGARAVVHGLTLATDPVEFSRAALEAVALRFGLVFELLCHVAPTAQSIIGSGAGLTESPTWMQIMADVLGRPLAPSGVPEASSRGGALLVLEALGIVSDLSHLESPIGPAFQPRAEITRIYLRAQRRQQDLETRLSGFESTP